MDTKIFVAQVLLDWYDGPIISLVKMKDSQRWYLASIVYFDTKTSQRIFQLIEVENSWVEEMQMTVGTEHDKYFIMKREVRKKFQHYTGADLYLVKCQYFDDGDLEIRKVPASNLMYFASIEKVIEQTILESEKWMSFFNK